MFGLHPILVALPGFLWRMGSNPSKRNHQIPTIDTVQPPDQIKDWRISYDEEGEEFFWNVKTRETTWDPPAEYEAWYDEQAVLDELPSFMDTTQEDDDDADDADDDAEKEEEETTKDVEYFPPTNNNGKINDAAGAAAASTTSEVVYAQGDQAGGRTSYDEPQQLHDFPRNGKISDAEEQTRNELDNNDKEKYDTNTMLNASTLAALAGVTELPAASEAALVSITQSHYTPKVVVVQLNQVRQKFDI